MHAVFADALDNFILVYLDNIIFPTSVQKHKQHLNWVFDKLNEHQLKAKLI